MRILLCALLLTIPFQQPDQKVFDCVVTEVKGGVAIVVGDSRNPLCSPSDNQEICVHATLDIPLESWPQAWPSAEKGLVIRAQWVNGHLRPVQCKSEQMRGLYDRPPLNSGPRPGVDTGFDCSRKPSQFILELLERMNK